MNRFIEYSNAVKAVAGGQWPYILQSLAGLDDKQVDVRWKNRGTPCPSCGGDDRYRFYDLNSEGLSIGSWACRGCGGGDGWELLERVCGWQFPDSVRAVAELLHIESPSTPDQSIIEDALKRAEQHRKQSEYKVRVETETLEKQYYQRARYAYKEWCNAVPADPKHPYLISHQLPSFDLRQIQHPVYGYCLLVPLVNEQRQLTNLERINPEGMKRPIKGALKKGCFYQFGKDSFTVYVAESWSTGAAIHINKPCRPVVLAAMSAGNMDAVAGIAKRLFPESEVVIAADHDETGIKTAVSVARKHSLNIVLPTGIGNDFCHLHINQGATWA